MNPEQILPSEVSGIENKHGWKTILKPKEEWYKDVPIYSDSPIAKIAKLSRVISKDERQKNKQSKELAEEISKEKSIHPDRIFVYKPGSGVEGVVGNGIAVTATGFYDCSGLVFQTKDGVGVVHISPNVYRQPEDGGEIVESQDVYSHINFVLKGLVKKDNRFSKTTDNVSLSTEEIEVFQKMIDSGELKATMISGETDFVPGLRVELAEKAGAHGLPYMKVDAHFVGNLVGKGGYDIYVNPEKLFVIGSNNVVFKKGENLPPSMFDFQDKE